MGVESGPFRGSGSKYILKGINSQCTCTCTISDMEIASHAGHCPINQ